MVVSRAAGRLRIGFRRDIQWFLSALVGFLVIVSLILLLLLQSFAQRAEDATRANWETIADDVAATLDRVDPGTSDQVVEAMLVGLRATHGIPAIRLNRERGGSSLSGDAAGSDLVRVSRETKLGTAAIYFDGSGIRQVRRTFRLTTVIVFASSIAGTILLLLYIPRILRPIDVMLDDARELGEREAHVGEDRYLIETFKRSIATLREQETELRRLHAEQKSRADELELVSATLTRSLGSGFIALDDGGRIVDINRAARDILELSDERETQGRELEAVLGGGEFSKRLEDAFRRRESLVRSEIHEPSSGKVMGLTTVPIVDETSRFIGMLGLFTDLTRIRDLEERVRAMDTLARLGEMSASIAHEIRNALSTILGHLKLARRVPMSTEIENHISDAESEGMLLSRAVDGLLNFARPVEPKSEPVDLLALVREVADSFDDVAESTRIDVAGQPVIVQADPALVRRAIENLIRNSIEAVEQKGAERGSIVVGVEPGPPARIVVEDDGVGIDPDAADSLVLPFHSTKPSGMGLGLAVARKVALLHGGRFRIGPRDGGGTRAVIELPDENDRPSG